MKESDKKWLAESNMRPDKRTSCIGKRLTSFPRAGLIDWDITCIDFLDEIILKV